MRSWKAVERASEIGKREREEKTTMDRETFFLDGGLMIASSEIERESR